ncbi:glycosyltransferase family 9 protein [Pseudodesulfovibrio sp.]|uniref:glycosyltransferase family 9 protein n=1 Tax=Pseudodesulfovibrio sp. TaxID=2035812 RepID=UPI00261B9EBF|nr:glycosyltransferase family 9 protein [Pseudodesulfovibrio sp.]MDD3311809.1 glycosyltransferase family 9 protein [Pseudodesulfovibrio sp.]
MNVLVINLTRFGDLIQTQPVVTGFRRLGCRVGLVCLENFASAATLLDGVDAVFPLPGARLLSGLDGDWRLAVRDADGFRARVLAEFPPDRTVNLTPSVAARLLARALTPDGAAAGFFVDEFGFNADSSAWAAFLQLAGGNRGASPFNICDIFRRTAGLAGEGNSLALAAPTAEVAARAETLLRAGVAAAPGFVAMQLGASEDRRRWPVEYFVRTARLLRERDGLVPVLLGTGGEAALGERFVEAFDGPCVNLVGRTSLAELAGVLAACRALVTNDTGTMHLAAGLGTPVCAVFLATAQPWDTGPYRAGNICLEPDLECHPCAFGRECGREHACRRAVTPEAMYAHVAHLLGGDRPGPFPGARAWLTRTGDDGFMDLVSLSGHGGTDRALWIAIQRAHYRPFLDGGRFAGKTGLAGRMSPGAAEGLYKTLTSAHDLLFLLSRQGMVLAQAPRAQAKAKFLTSWQRLQNVLGANDYLNMLGLLWKFESQRHGGDLASLLGMTDRYLGLFASLKAEFE